MHAIYMRRWVREGKRRANSPPLIYYIFIFSANLLIDANLTIDWGEKLFYYFLFCIFKLSQNSSKKIIAKSKFPHKTFIFLVQQLNNIPSHMYIMVLYEAKVSKTISSHIHNSTFGVGF